MSTAVMMNTNSTATKYFFFQDKFDGQEYIVKGTDWYEALKWSRQYFYEPEYMNTIESEENVNDLLDYDECIQYYEM